MMAKRVTGSIVIELTRNAVGGISPALCSMVAFDDASAGFQPIGQNGLRLSPSISKEDLTLSSTAAATSLFFFSSDSFVFGATCSAMFLSVAPAAAFAGADEAAFGSFSARVRTAKTINVTRRTNDFIAWECN